MLIYFLIVTGVILLLLSSSLNLNYGSEEKTQKVFLFECGFNMSSMMSNKFSNQFFLVAILFLIFDLEIMIIFPLMNQCVLMNAIVYPLIIFLGFITLILALEWKQGMIEWSK